MKAKLFVLCIVFALLTGLITGCGSKQSEKTPRMNIDYVNGQTVYTGTEQRFYQVKEGRAGELKITVTRESGKLNISVCRSDDETDCRYRGVDIPTSDFAVTLTEPGEYRVLIEADKFAGGYGFNWSEK